jgi:chemotaxis protein MotB
MAELEQPIIIKKIIKNEGGHHGGAWKVAYADFVTAMMAFFLLLWLLSSASDGQLSGLADYFSPTIGLTGAMGIGFDGGDVNNMEDGTKKNDLSAPGIVAGQAPQGIKPDQPKKKAVIESPEAEDLLFQQRGRLLKEQLSEGDFNKFSDNVVVKQTPEGLKIQLLDSDKVNMFEPGRIQLSDEGKLLLNKLVAIVRGMPNYISVTGHTDGTPFTARRNYSNWELSTERANAARRHMEYQGLEVDRIAKVQGRADKELYVPANPKDAKNRRIEIILLRGEYMVVPEADAPITGGFTPQITPKDDVLKFEDAGANVMKEAPIAPAPATPAQSITPTGQMNAAPVDALEP